MTEHTVADASSLSSSGTAAFDPAVLRRLIEDTDSRTFVLELARTYCRLLPERVERMQAALASVHDEGGPEELLDAARSLRGASLMTGAGQLAELASAIQRDTEDGDLAACGMRVAALPSAAERVHEEMSEFVGGLTCHH